MRPRLRGLRWPRLGDVLGDTDAIAPSSGMLAAPARGQPTPLGLSPSPWSARGGGGCRTRTCGGGGAGPWGLGGPGAVGTAGTESGLGSPSGPGSTGRERALSRPAGAAGGSRSPAEPPSAAPVPRCPGRRSPRSRRRHRPSSGVARAAGSGPSCRDTAWIRMLPPASLLLLLLLLLL